MIQPAYSKGKCLHFSNAGLSHELLSCKGRQLSISSFWLKQLLTSSFLAKGFGINDGWNTPCVSAAYFAWTGTLLGRRCKEMLGQGWRGPLQCLCEGAGGGRTAALLLMLPFLNRQGMVYGGRWSSAPTLRPEEPSCTWPTRATQPCMLTVPPSMTPVRIRHISIPSHIGPSVLRVCCSFSQCMMSHSGSSTPGPPSILSSHLAVLHFSGNTGELRPVISPFIRWWGREIFL